MLKNTHPNENDNESPVGIIEQNDNDNDSPVGIIEQNDNDSDNVSPVGIIEQNDNDSDNVSPVGTTVSTEQNEYLHPHVHIVHLIHSGGHIRKKVCNWHHVAVHMKQVVHQHGTKAM